MGILFLDVVGALPLRAYMRLSSSVSLSTRASLQISEAIETIYHNIDEALYSGRAAQALTTGINGNSLFQASSIQRLYACVSVGSGKATAPTRFCALVVQTDWGPF